MSHNVFIILSVSFIALSIACQIMIGVIIQNMIHETDNMTATDNKLLRQCKLKFMNCYQMNGGVHNIQIFTEKFINRMKIGKISLTALGHLSGQLVLLSVFIAGAGIYFGITRGETVLGLLPFYIISFLGLYLYFSVSSAVDIPGKKKILKTNLVDYFENHMMGRLGTVPDSLRELEEKEEAARTAGSSRVLPAGSRETARMRANTERTQPEREARDQETESWQQILRDSLTEEEIQALLTEFLT